MGYPEMLRVRGVVRNVLIIVVVFVVLGLGTLAFTHGHWAMVSVGGNGHDHLVSLHDALVMKHVKIPFSALFVVPAIVAAIVATVLGTSLNRENDTLASIWTKPAARSRIALGFVALDTLGIVLTIAIALGVGEFTVLSTLWLLPFVTFGPDALRDILLLIGFSFATYGATAALTSWSRRGGGLIAGLYWPIGLILYGLTAVGLPDALHHAIVALNFLNPIAYVGSTGDSDQGSHSNLPLALTARISLEWLLAIVTTSFAIYAWQRREA